jgi:hypothetical protein
MTTPGDDREASWEASHGDALDVFFRQHRLCSVVDSAVNDEAETISVTCRRCGASVVLPLT